MKPYEIQLSSYYHITHFNIYCIKRNCLPIKRYSKPAKKYRNQHESIHGNAEIIDVYWLTGDHSRV
jgi:hypothetical protein